jgi:hypothetical protein
MRLLGLIAVLVGLVLAAGCGGEDAEPQPTEGEAATKAQPGNTLVKGDGYTFEYPEELEPSEVEFLENSPGEIEQNALFAGDFDLVALILYKLEPSVEPDEVDEYTKAYDSSYRELVRNTKGTIASGPDEIELDGIPGLRYTGTTGLKGGGTAETKTTILFDGDVQYYFECQWTPKHAPAIKRACQVVLDTFDTL